VAGWDLACSNAAQPAGQAHARRFSRQPCPACCREIVNGMKQYAVDNWERIT